VDDVVAEHVAQRRRVAHRLDLPRTLEGLRHGGHGLQDLGELLTEPVELGVVELDPGQPGQVRDVVAGDLSGHGRHPTERARH
jgi:hypothetical protein